MRKLLMAMVFLLLGSGCVPEIEVSGDSNMDCYYKGSLVAQIKMHFTGVVLDFAGTLNGEYVVQKYPDITCNIQFPERV